MLAMALFSTVMRGQSVGGTVVDAQGLAVQGVSIFAHSEEVGGSTDAAGHFEIGPLKAGRVVLQMSAVGFRTQQVVSDVPARGLLISMEADILGINEVVIATERASQGQCMVKIATMDIEQLDRNASPSRIQALDAEPGVDMITAGSGMLRPVIRGLSGLRVATLYRGARIESQAWGADHGIYLPEQGVDRVEIIRGPSALAYGADASGGVLNFLPEDPLGKIGRKSVISLRGFSATSGVRASLMTKKRSRHAHHAFSGGYNQHGNYFKPDGERVANSGYHQFFGQGAWGYILDWGKIDGGYASSYNTAGMIGTESGWQQSGDHLITSSATLWKGGWKWAPSLTYQLNHRKEFEQKPEGDNGEEGEGSEAVADLDLSLRTLRYGLEATRFDAGPFTLVLGAQGAKSSNENAGDQFLPDAEIGGLGGYSIATWQRGDLALQGGFRYDFQQVDWAEGSRSFGLPSCSFGATAELSKRTQLRASYALGQRAPGLSELAADGQHHGPQRYEIGNAELSAEKSHNLEASLHRKGGELSWDVALYAKHIRDFIHLVKQPIGSSPDVFHFTASDAQFLGGEIGARYEPAAARGLHLKAALAHVHAEQTSGEALPLIPPTRLTAECGWAKEQAGNLSNAHVTLVTDCTRDYALLHLSLGADLSKCLYVGLAARNLLNTSYIPELSLLKNIGVVEPGRNISLRLNLTL